jgi:hypothetical protein
LRTGKGGDTDRDFLQALLTSLLGVVFPFEGLRFEQWADLRVTTQTAASRAVSCSSEYSWSPPYGAYRVGSIPPWRLSFPARLRGLSADAIHPIPRTGTLPLLSFTSASEFVPVQPAFISRIQRLPWGSVLHRDISTRSPPAVRALPRCVPPSAFLTLSTIYSSECLRSMLAPLPRPRFSLQGFSPPTRRPDSSSAHPLLTLAHSLRLQGFAPLGDPLRVARSFARGTRPIPS